MRTRFGEGTFIYRAEPINAGRVASEIAALASEEDEEQLAMNGGSMSLLFSLLEAMTGIPYAGAFTPVCDPVMPKVSYALNKVRQNGILDKLEPGHRYFFGHRLP
jgi:hypothetical protein